MPSPHPDAARLKAEILGRVLAGESLRAVGRAAGMPCAQTVRNWAAADPLFAADLLDARRRGDWRRRFAFDEAVAAEFLARARAGETINDLLREPGMPSRRTYDYWKARQYGFAEAVFALRQRRDEGIGARGRALAGLRGGPTRPTEGDDPGGGAAHPQHGAAAASARRRAPAARSAAVVPAFGALGW